MRLLPSRVVSRPAPRSPPLCPTPPVSLYNSSAGCPGTRFADQAGTKLCLELKVYATSTPPPPGCYSALSQIFTSYLLSESRTETV